MITKMLGGTHNDLQIASEELYTKFKQSFKQLPDWNEYCVHLKQLTDARESYFIWRDRENLNQELLLIKLNLADMILNL